MKIQYHIGDYIFEPSKVTLIKGDAMGIECNYMTLDAIRQSYDFMMIVDIEHTCTHDGSIPPEEREIIEFGAVVVDKKSLTILVL